MSPVTGEDGPLGVIQFEIQWPGYSKGLYS